MNKGKSSYYVYKVVHYVENAITQSNWKDLHSGFDLVLLTTLLFP